MDVCYLGVCFFSPQYGVWVKGGGGVCTVLYWILGELVFVGVFLYSALRYAIISPRTYCDCINILGVRG